MIRKRNYFMLLSGMLLAITGIMAAGVAQAKHDERGRYSLFSEGHSFIAQTYVYECSDGYRFTARIEDGHAWLLLPDQTVRFLPHAISGSGAKYSDGMLTFWNKGEEALLEARGGSHRECRNNPTEAIWEEARLRGIDFRAIGNEPGWYLEITEGERIVFVTDYGETRYEFTAPEPKVDRQAAVTIYQVSDEEHELVIVLKEQLCHDSMSGEAFETTVIVSLDGEEYRGCGRHLH